MPTKEEIKEYWSKMAKQDCQSPVSLLPIRYLGTHRDYNLQHLEMTTLLKYLNGNEEILDVGCGKGYTSLYLVFKKHVSIFGLDYSQPMIREANQIKDEFTADYTLSGRLEYMEGDILDFKDSNSFDIVYSERCLINIPTWEEQKKAIDVLTQVVKKDGLLLLFEGSQQGLIKLNHLRDRYGLGDIMVVWYNLFLDDSILVEYASKSFELVEINNFCSTYMVISRVLHPALVSPREPEYNDRINDLALRLPNHGDFSYLKLYVFRKK